MMNKRTDRLTDGCTNGWMDARMADGLMMEGRMKKIMIES